MASGGGQPEVELPEGTGLSPKALWLEFENRELEVVYRDEVIATARTKIKILMWVMACIILAEIILKLQSPYIVEEPTTARIFEAFAERSLGPGADGAYVGISKL